MQLHARQPNILFIVADDHRHDAIGALGHPTVQTPNLDRLVEDGTAYLQAHIMGGLSGAVCMPSRASILSGANVFRAGGQFEIAEELELLPETLQKHGYETYAVGKWHNDLASFNKSFTGGSRIFFGGMSEHEAVPTHAFDPSGQYPEAAAEIREQHSSELFSDAAIAFVESREAKDKPYFLYLAYTAPHDPRTAPERFHARYPAAQIQLPPNYASEHPFETGEMDVRDEQLAALPRRGDEVRQNIADYYAIISHLDEQIGRVLRTLADREQLENTLIVYTADHGLSVGQHGLLGKQNMYDHSVRIPWILRGPDVPQGVRLEGLISQIDIYPTICDYLGIPRPETLEGRSHFPQWASGNAGRDYVCAVFRNYQRMIKNGRWKLIRYYYDEETADGSDRLQLFDLVEDPWETVNLAQRADLREILLELAEALRAWQYEVGDPLVDRPILLD